MDRAKYNKIFKSIPNNTDIHSYRSDYCNSIYNMFARDVNTLPKSDIYYCRSE